MHGSYFILQIQIVSKIRPVDFFTDNTTSIYSKTQVYLSEGVNISLRSIKAS